MTYTTAFLLGLIQALGEFLPISSSAHLALWPFFAGTAYQGLTFDVLLHLATLIAVVAYFYKDLIILVKQGLTAPKSEDGRLFWFIGLATIPAAVAGYFLDDLAENAFRNPLLIACTLIIFALILWKADAYNKDVYNKEKGLSKQPTALILLLIGCAQALAIVPGVSRSGVTISMALFLGLTRVASARISFLLSVPIIAGAAVLKLKDITFADINGPLLCGFFTAMIVGWLTIKFLMRFISKHNFNVFVYYRIALGILIFALYIFKF